MTVITHGWRPLALALVLATAAVAGCEEEDAAQADPCTQDGELRCSDDESLLEECVGEQWELVEDCAEQGLTCHLEMEHCM